jgi:hypothetical protein
MANLLCVVLGCTDDGSESVKVKDTESGEESYRDVCRKHYDEIQRNELSASWDPILQAVRLP